MQLLYAIVKTRLMKIEIRLLALAVIPNLTAFLLYKQAASQPGGTGALMVYLLFMLPAIWLITLIIGFIVYRKRRSIWFNKSHLFTTIILIFFATPIPFLYFLKGGFSDKPYIPIPIVRNPPFKVETNTDTIGKYQHKFERFIYSAFHDSLKSYWIADTAELRRLGESAYKKDSIWTYYDTSGKVVKVEYYKNGKLIKASY